MPAAPTSTCANSLLAVPKSNLLTAKEQAMSRNQKILAGMIAADAIRAAQRGPTASPHQQLMCAMEEAIADARERRDRLAKADGAGSEDYLRINAQIARWEAARRNNR